MKRIFFCVALEATTLAGPTVTTAMAQQEVELKEVTVQGVRTVQRADGQWIFPSRQQLETSADGYALLAKLALPHIRIDPTLHTITALSNLGSVQVRINDVEATSDDLLSLDLQGVERIEWTDNPGVRYGEGVACVINLVVHRPTSGYAMGVDLTQTLTARNGRTTIYGKANSGRSELGASYTAAYHHLTGMEHDEQARYTLASDDVLLLHRHLQSGSNRRLAHNAQLTYSLCDSVYVLQARLSGRFEQPRGKSQWSVENGVNKEAYTNHTKEYTASPTLDVYFHHTLGASQSLTANAVGTHIRTDADTEAGEGGCYRYHTRGRTWSLWSEAVYENRLRPFTLSLGAQYALRYIGNTYSGDAEARNHMHSLTVYLFGQLKGHLGRMGYAGGVGISLMRYRQGADSYRFHLLRPKLSVSYPLARRLKVKYDVEVSQHVSRIALVSDVSIKQNAMETLLGNPSIRPNRVTSHDVHLTYSTPRLSLDLQGYYRLNHHVNMEQYIRRDDHFYLTQTNDRNRCNFFYVQSDNRRDIVPERLTVSAYGGVFRYFNYGPDYTHTYTAFIGGGSMDANLGHWTLSAYADSGWRFMEGEHRGLQGAAWYMTASYRMRQLTVSLYLQHPFCATPRTNHAEVRSRYVQKDVLQHQRDYGNMLTLSLAWKLSAGRQYRDIRRAMNHQDRETGILAPR